MVGQSDEDSSRQVLLGLMWGREQNERRKHQRLVGVDAARSLEASDAGLCTLGEGHRTG
jgi:hypothetical protein